VFFWDAETLWYDAAKWQQRGTEDCIPLSFLTIAPFITRALVGWIKLNVCGDV